MAHLDLEEQEQLAQLKTWWATYGNLIVSTLVAVALGFSGWQAWRWWNASQSTQASALYEALNTTIQGKDAKAVRETGGMLLEKYPRTAYASMGALGAAKFFFEKGDLKDAQAQLQWVVDKAGSEEFRDLARLRMANVLLDEKKPDEALKLLDATHGAAFDAQYAMLKGDILVAMKKSADAKSAYRLALEKADKKDAGMRERIQMRLDALGG